MKVLQGLLIGGVVLYILNKVGTASVASTLNFRIGRIDMDNGNPIINIIAQNPQSAGFNIYSIVGDVYLNDSAIGNISLFTPIHVAPVSETPIPLTLRLSVFGALENLRIFVTGGFDGVDLAVKGTVNIDNTLLPLDVSILNKQF